MAGAGKEKKSKEDGGSSGTAALLRRLGDDIAALRSEVEKMKSGGNGTAASAPERAATSGGVSGDKPPTESLQERLRGEKDAAVMLGYAYRLRDGAGNNIGAQDSCLHSGLEGILAADDNTVARLGYALSSAPKVAILRALLWDGPQSAAQLGATAKLTTGSLYHHLRELTHADVIRSAGRNRFEMTEIGRETALLLFVQAARKDSAPALSKTDR